MRKAAVDSYSIYHNSYEGRRYRSYPLQEYTAGIIQKNSGVFLLDRTEAKERGMMTGVCVLNQVWALPSFLLLCYIPWCNLRSSFIKHLSKHLSLKLCNYLYISGKIHNLQLGSSGSYLILKLHCYNVLQKSIYSRTSFAMYQKYKVCFTSVSFSEKKCTKQNEKSQILCRTNSFQCKLPLLEQGDQPGQFWGMTLSGTPTVA